MVKTMNKESEEYLPVNSVSTEMGEGRKREGRLINQTQQQKGDQSLLFCIETISTHSVVCGCNISITLALVRIADPTSG